MTGTRIDLRYVIVVLAFYAPGALMLVGAWLLGYSTAEAREDVMVIGGPIGALAAWSAGFMFIYGHPIWWRIGGRDD